MRSIDPVTGRTRAAQRSGVSKFNGNPLPGSGRVQELTPIAFDVPTSTYEILDAAMESQPNPTVEVWRNSSPSGRSFVAIVAEPSGSVIAMDDQGVFTRYSSDGEKQTGGMFPRGDNEIMDGNLVRDVQGGLIGSAWDPAATVNGGASRIFRMREVEDQGWQIHWVLGGSPYVVGELTLTSRVTALAGEFGNIYAAVQGQIPEGALSGSLWMFSQGLTSLPQPVWATQTPGPVGGLAVGVGGVVYATIGADPNRGGGSDGYEESVVFWTPRQLEDLTRIYSWLDMSDQGIADGDPDFTTNEHRVHDSRPGAYQSQPADFEVVRPLWRAFHNTIVPSFRSDVMPRPCLSFGTSAPLGGVDPTVIGMEAFDNADVEGEVSGGKTSTTGKLEGQGAIFPGYDGAIFTTYMVVRGIPSATVEVLMQQSCRNPDAPVTQITYGVLLNSPSSGKVTLDINSGSLDSADAGAADAVEPGTYDVDSRNTFLLTFQHSGLYTETIANSCFRVNGSQVDRFHMLRDLSWNEDGGTAETTVGCVVRASESGESGDPSVPGDELYAGSGHSQFNGYIAETITVLGEHFNGIHDGVPDGPQGADAGAISGTVDTDNRADASGMEYIEGYLAHKWGIPDLLPNGVSPETPVGGFYPNHPFGGVGNPPGFDPSDAGLDTSFNLASEQSITAKYYADGSFAWAHAGSGMGRGVAFYNDTENDKRWVYTVGNSETETGIAPNDSGAANYVVRRILDEGPGFSVDSGDGAWLSNAAFFEYETVPHAPIIVSSSGDVWFHAGNTFGLSGLLSQAQRFAGGDHTDDPGIRQAYHTFVENFNPEDIARRLNGLVFDLDEPFYGAGVDPLGAEFMYAVIGDGDVPGQAGEIIKVQILKETRDPEAQPRTTQVVGVRGGQVSSFGKGMAAPEDLGLHFDPLADVYGTVLYGKAYYTDGKAYKVYDPNGGVGGSVEDWMAEKGSMPKRARLLTSWRGRAILARFDGNPYGWVMSRIKAPLDWDVFPEVVTVDQAVTGETAPQASDVPDIINCIIPYSDDLLIFGCDSSLYRLTGEPMLNGQIDLLSDVTGIAFGTPWSKDPQGVLYFFGSKGGVFAMTPGGLPQNIVESRIERDLQDLDRAQFKLEMEWDYRNEGLHVFVIGRTDGVTHDSWFWDKKNNAWWEDSYGQPVTASAVFDGDGADDRAVLVGSEDGYVRYVDQSAATDDTVRIDSSLLFGPISGPQTRVLVSQLDALLDQGEATFQCFTGEDPKNLGDPIYEGTLRAGYNEPRFFRIAGNQFWVRVRNATEKRWSMEALALHVANIGRKRTTGA